MEIRYSKSAVKAKNLAFEMVKKLVLAWDPDFTKLTPAEQAELEQAEAEMKTGEYVSDSAINWG